MALGTQAVTLGGASKNIIVALDGSSNEAVAHVNVDASGAEKGVSANPFTIAGSVAVGSPPTNPPLSVSGVDGSGNKQHFLTDTAGRQAIACGTTVTTGQVSVATTAGGTVIAASRTGRVSLTVINHGTTDVFLGASGVTASTGILLAGAKGQTYTLDGAAALYGIVASGTQTVSYSEAY